MSGVATMRAAAFIKYSAFVLMSLFSLFAGLFVAGYVIQDPGGGKAALLITAAAVPGAILCVLAYLWPRAAGTVLVALAALVVVSNVIAAVLGPAPRSWNVVDLMGALAPSVAAAGGVLGLRRPAQAGWLLIALALGQAVGALGPMFHGSGEPWSAALSSSTGAPVVPVLVIGALFLLAGYWPQRPAAAAPVH